ncbi:unnamed protein product [Amoebophrya sp. A25]|nr:unnamed protein product [Amoebophrya sp. A25]|eukprot:GSA25T00024914001.1
MSFPMTGQAAAGYNQAMMTSDRRIKGHQAATTLRPIRIAWCCLATLAAVAETSATSNSGVYLRSEGSANRKMKDAKVDEQVLDDQNSQEEEEDENEQLDLVETSESEVPVDGEEEDAPTRSEMSDKEALDAYGEVSSSSSAEAGVGVAGGTSRATRRSASSKSKASAERKPSPTKVEIESDQTQTTASPPSPRRSQLKRPLAHDEMNVDKIILTPPATKAKVEQEHHSQSPLPKEQAVKLHQENSNAYSSHHLDKGEVESSKLVTKQAHMNVTSDVSASASDSEDAAATTRKEKAANPINTVLLLVIVWSSLIILVEFVFLYQLRAGAPPMMKDEHAEGEAAEMDDVYEEDEEEPERAHGDDT